MKGGIFCLVAFYNLELSKIQDVKDTLWYSELVKYHEKSLMALHQKETVGSLTMLGFNKTVDKFYVINVASISFMAS